MSGSVRPEMELSQHNFLAGGGVFALALARKRKSGEMASSYEYNEYPKMLRLSRGVKTVICTTETISGAVRTWEEQREEFDEIIVNSEEDEERVLSGGKTSAQIETDRQELIQRCRAAGIKTDPKWSAVRLRRELGDRLNESDQPDKMAALQAELATLRKMADMQSEIEKLKMQLGDTAATETDGLRAQLHELGVTADKRWGIARLREELDKATAPVAAAP